METLSKAILFVLAFYAATLAVKTGAVAFIIYLILLGVVLWNMNKKR